MAKSSTTYPNVSVKNSLYWAFFENNGNFLPINSNYLEINAVKTKVATLVLVCLWFGVSAVRAEMPVYKSTENEGLNKNERIDSVESYLASMAKSLNGLEQKLNENSQKLKDLDKLVKLLKEEQAKKVDSKLGEVKQPTPENPTGKPEPSELEKLKADVMAMKNQDIEKLRTSLDELSDTVKAIQTRLK